MKKKLNLHHTQELSNLVQDTDPLDYGEIKTAEQILAQTSVLESINVDEEAMQSAFSYHPYFLLGNHTPRLSEKFAQFTFLLLHLFINRTVGVAVYNLSGVTIRIVPFSESSFFAEQ